MMYIVLGQPMYVRIVGVGVSCVAPMVYTSEGGMIRLETLDRAGDLVDIRRGHGKAVIV